MRERRKAGLRPPRLSARSGSSEFLAVLPFPALCLDAQNRIVEVNREWLELMGYQRADAIGRSFAAFLITDSADRYTVAAGSKGTTRPTGNVELSFLTKTNEHLDMLLSIRTLYESGEPKTLAVLTDLRPIRRAELKSRRHAEQYRMLVENITEYAVYLISPDGLMLSWNAGAQRMKGYTADEAIGSSYSLVYTDEDRAAGAPDQALHLARTQGRYATQGWRVRKDGSRFWADVVIQALLNRDESLLGFAKISRDITPQLQQQEALEQARMQLAQSQKMEAVGQLTGGVAHDFNNLLTVIIGNLELLQHHRPTISPEERSRLAAIRGAAERGAGLSQRLLAFSRRQALQPINVDLNKLVSGMADLIRRTLAESIALETVLGAGLWRTFVDQNQLENALLNLVVNAQDAMPAGGKLTIETGNTYIDEQYAAAHVEVRPGQYVLMAVSDTGCGMDAETLSRAFEPFFTTKAEDKGTGLGLSQVFGFVKQSGGHIKLYSEVGQGTTVRIYLPRYHANGGTQAEPAMPNIGSKGGGETVMVVEDDAQVLEYTVSALQALGYHVIQAENGHAALAAMTVHQEISLLFTDVGLPGMNGRLLAEEAKRRIPHLRVLFTTGYARNAIVHNGLLDAGVHLLPKPFTIDGLARKLREVLDEYESALVYWATSSGSSTATVRPRLPQQGLDAL